MKRFALALAIILGCTAVAVAAAPDGTGHAAKAAKSRKAPAKTHAAPARETPREDPRSGDITITGKAGSITQVTYGNGAKPEQVKAAGQ